MPLYVDDKIIFYAQQYIDFGVPVAYKWLVSNTKLRCNTMIHKIQAADITLALQADLGYALSLTVDGQELLAAAFPLLLMGGRVQTGADSHQRLRRTHHLQGGREGNHCSGKRCDAAGDHRLNFITRKSRQEQCLVGIFCYYIISVHFGMPIECISGESVTRRTNSVLWRSAGSHSIDQRSWQNRSMQKT